MRTEVLDCGYVEKIEHWGSDERIVEAARMSTGKGFLGWGSRCKNCGLTVDEAAGGNCAVPSTDALRHEWGPGDEKLLRYLYENRHNTPFEMAGLVIEVKAPIMVFREWHRHRTQSYNEMSARYTPLPDENYLPTVERLMLNSKTNKQAGKVAGAGELDEVEARRWVAMISDFYKRAEDMYQVGLERGVPKEIARIMLPVGRYSRMRASANLRNWLAFLTLRMDCHAQFEIQRYAEAVHSILVETFPRTMGLFDAEGR